MCNTQRLSLVHAEGSCSLAITVAFWSKLLAVARLAINFISVDRNSGAVQVLPTDHAEEAGLVEAPPVTEHLLRKVNCLQTAAALVSSS